MLLPLYIHMRIAIMDDENKEGDLLAGCSNNHKILSVLLDCRRYSSCFELKKNASVHAFLLFFCLF